MTNCSDDFPMTDVFYNELPNDVAAIVLMAIGGCLTLVMIAVFLEEVYYLHVHRADKQRLRKILVLLGLYPVIAVSSLMSLVVPSSTILVDLMATCYVSVCIYTFVKLVMDYFGGAEKMTFELKEETVVLASPPCCCCCRCLPRIQLSKRALLRLKMCALQVAVIRPLVLAVAAVLWTDGKYGQGEMDPSSGNMYISVLSGVSTLLSMYALIIVYRVSRPHLNHQLLGLKFFSLQLTVVFVNIQNILFGALARYSIPDCIGSRGPMVRGSNLNHAILIIEIFLLSLLARLAYRRPEPAPELTNMDMPTYRPDSK